MHGDAKQDLRPLSTLALFADPLQIHSSSHGLPSSRNASIFPQLLRPRYEPEYILVPSHQRMPLTILPGQCSRPLIQLLHATGCKGCFGIAVHLTIMTRKRSDLCKWDVFHSTQVYAESGIVAPGPNNRSAIMFRRTLEQVAYLYPTVVGPLVGLVLERSRIRGYT